MSTSDEAVVVWGEVLWDRFPDGDQLGGAPANVAWHLAQAGGWARLVTRVGDDEDGRRAIARLGEVVDTSLVQVDPERATGEVTIRLENGEPRYTMHPGRAWERIECTPAVRSALASAGVLIYGTLSQHTAAGRAAWQQAIAAAHATCLEVCDLNLRKTKRGQLSVAPAIVDATGTALAGEAELVREALMAAELVKINDQELAVLGPMLGWRDPIGELRAGNRIIAVTHGADGSTLHGEGGAIEIPGVRAAPGGDNVGCGDAYLAILVLTMTMGWDLQASGEAASRYAAAVAEVRGATPLFSEEQIAELLGFE